MVLLGTRNSRMKDYFDVDALLREQQTEADQLANAIAATFERRRTPLPEGIPAGLSDAFATDAAKQAQWQAFVVRNRLSAPALHEIVAKIRERLTEALVKARQLKVKE